MNALNWIVYKTRRVFSISIINIFHKSNIINSSLPKYIYIQNNTTQLMANDKNLRKQIEQKNFSVFLKILLVNLFKLCKILVKKLLLFSIFFSFLLIHLITHPSNLSLYIATIRRLMEMTMTKYATLYRSNSFRGNIIWTE